MTDRPPHPRPRIGLAVAQFLLLVAGLLAAACVVPATVRAQDGASPAALRRPPNIVLIVADDLGYGELGCYGQRIIRTPHLDRMAAEGIRFTQFYTGQAVCAPARCVLLTGRHTGHAFIRDNANPTDGSEKLHPFPGQIPLPDAEVTIAERLRDSGYATGATGKWGLGHSGTTGDPTRQGFDHFFGFLCQVHAHNHYPRFLWRNGERIPLPGNDRTLHGESYSQDLFVDEAIRFIGENRERPFFLYLPFAVPHLSIQVPDESVREYGDTIEEAGYRHTAYLRHPTPRAAYAAMVTHMDKGIGRILKTLDRTGLDEDTIVFFTSDNGPAFDRLGGTDSDFFESTAGLRGRKGSLFEGGIRVPLIARWPGRIAAGSVSDHPSAYWDVFPSLEELARIGSTTKDPQPEIGTEDPLDGISLVPTLLGSGEQPAHPFLYWEFPGYGGQQAIRSGNWKLLRRNLNRRGADRTGAGNPPPAGPSLSLYDLTEDRGETNDRAAAEPETVARLLALIPTARRPSPQFPFPALDNPAVPSPDGR